MFARRMTFLHRFRTAETGAVTTDWVVLTAAIVGLGIGTVSLVRSGTGALGNDVSASLSGSTVASLDCMGTNDGPSGFACYDGPTISSAGMMYAWASMPYCTMDLDGGGSCTGGSSGTSQQFLMSDGTTYNHSTSTSNGETTAYWTDSSGTVVDAPPPMADGTYNYPMQEFTL